MGVSHLFHIGCQLLRDLPVVVELAAVDVLTVLILCYRFLHPGTKMDLIDGHRGILQAVFRRFDLAEDFSIETAVVVGELYRHNGEWKFNAIGSGFQGGLAALCAHFGIDVA